MEKRIVSKSLSIYVKRESFLTVFSHFLRTKNGLRTNETTDQRTDPLLEMEDVYLEGATDVSYLNQYSILLENIIVEHYICVRLKLRLGLR